MVGVDESEDSMNAVKKALEFTKSNNTKVIVFHSVIHHLNEIVPNFSLSGPNSIISYEIHEDYINNGKRILADVENVFMKEGQKVETRLIIDVLPEDYIKKITKEEKIELVILGCKGKHSKLKRTFLGTIPDKVSNDVDSDVLLVR